MARHHNVMAGLVPAISRALWRLSANRQEMADTRPAPDDTGWVRPSVNLSAVCYNRSHGEARDDQSSGYDDGGCPRSVDYRLCCPRPGRVADASADSQASDGQGD